MRNMHQHTENLHMLIWSHWTVIPASFLHICVLRVYVGTYAWIFFVNNCFFLHIFCTWLHNNAYSYIFFACLCCHSVTGRARYSTWHWHVYYCVVPCKAVQLSLQHQPPQTQQSTFQYWLKIPSVTAASASAQKSPAKNTSISWTQQVYLQHRAAVKAHEGPLIWRLLEAI